MASQREFVCKYILKVCSGANICIYNDLKSIRVYIRIKLEVGVALPGMEVRTVT